MMPSGSGSGPASDPRMAPGPSNDSAGIQQLQSTTLLAGIDISEGGMKGALRRLSSARHIPPWTGALESGAPGAEGTEGPQPLPTSSSPPPTPSVSVQRHGLDGTVRLYLGSCLSRALRSPEAWGDLGGCAVATLVEVVEHLDQPLLEWVDPF